MRRRLFDSLMGGVLPAVIGVIATLLLTGFALHDPRVALLLVWTIIGYLSLTDFGLTRAASKLATTLDTEDQEVVAYLWRSALPFGSAGAVALAAIGIFSGNAVFAIALLPVPLIAALQFPLVGVLEAAGRFGYLAVHRLMNAITSYLVPVTIIILWPDQVLLATALVSVTRTLLFLLMCRRLELPLIATVRSAATKSVGISPQTGSVVGWLAASSMLGPLLLYADRVVLAIIDGTGSEWVFYVALSEILMKTYIIPTALVAVLFPWLAANVKDLHPARRRLLRTWLPAVSLPTAVFAGLVSAFVFPEVLLPLLGARTEWIDTARLVLAFCVAATVLNWASQIHIAVLHAMDAHKFVGAFQIATAVPFLAGLVIAAQLGGIGAVSAVVFLRVVFTWLALIVRGRRALPPIPTR